MVIINAIKPINKNRYDIDKFVMDTLDVIIASDEEISPNCLTSNPLILILLNIYDKIKHSIPDTILIILSCDVDITKHNKENITIKMKNETGISFIEKITSHIRF